MTEQQIWVIPGDPSDMAPLPALLHDTDRVAPYQRRPQTFGNAVVDSFSKKYPDFESCRAAMIVERTAMLQDLNRHCRELAASIEHIKTIPPAAFPNVQREVRAQGQQQEEAQKQQEKAEGQQKEVKPSPELRKRPARS